MLTVEYMNTSIGYEHDYMRNRRSCWTGSKQNLNSIADSIHGHVPRH